MKTSLANLLAIRKGKCCALRHLSYAHVVIVAEGGLFPGRPGRMLAKGWGAFGQSECSVRPGVRGNIKGALGV